MDAQGEICETAEDCPQSNSTQVVSVKAKKGDGNFTITHGKPDIPSQTIGAESHIKSTFSVNDGIINASISIDSNDIKNKESNNEVAIPKTINHKRHSEQEETKEEENLQITGIESHTSGENELKHRNEDAVNELAQKGGYNLKRKHRNASLQETNSISEENGTRTKRKKFKTTTDRFCWRCHKESVEAYCSACPRSWHRKCMGGTPPLSVDNWICGECATILRAENAETRSIAMAQLSIDQLCMLLKHVVQRMRDYPGSEPFWKPVETADAPNYFEYVVKPMDLTLLETNVRTKLYGSTDAFMADAKWIQHNCIVFNTCGGVYTDTSKLTNAAKQMIKLARQEVSEIEACPDCFAHGRNLPRPQPSWFIEPCSRPHPLVWAKLKGFPFWPAKAMPRVNSQGYVDVRFFGEHDRAWVAPRDLFLYSQDPPAPLPRKRKTDMDECVREITRHCRKLELVFGQFKFAPPKVQYNPHDPMQIKLMLPNYDPLQPSHFLNSQFLTTKRRMLLRKRGLSLGKTKTQNDLLINVPPDHLGSNTLPDSINNPEKKNKSNNAVANARKDEIAGVNKARPASSAMIVTNDKDRQSVSPSRTSVTIEGKQTVDNDLIGLAENEVIGNSKTIAEEASKAIATGSILKSETITFDDTLKERKKIGSPVGKHTQKVGKLEGSSKQKSLSADNLAPDTNLIKTEEFILTPEKILPEESSVSHNGDSEKKSDALHSIGGGTQKVGSKTTKSNIAKVYKPKTRMVDKVNAEEALKSVTATRTKEKSNSSCTERLVDAHDDVRPASAESCAKHSTTDQSLALLLVVNSEMKEVSKQSSTVVNNQMGENLHTVIKQEPRDQHNILSLPQKKESRARKSLPNKPPNYPQHPLAICRESSTPSKDSVLYIPTSQNEHLVPHQMTPPEAGPLSARLFNGAQELARKMAQLMEEAYKEAAEQNTEEEKTPVTTDNHRATVHFLRLQIERMRWQHQQQVAELKHNADRILREMRASLEAERFRAVEETRRVAEEDKIRSIEETKRKQWCAMCGHEAVFYCCWNTAYCDYPCQQSHWATHMRTCAQQPSFTAIVTSTSSSTPQLQSHQEQHQKRQPQQMQPQQQVMPRLVINTHHAAANQWTT